MAVPAHDVELTPEVLTVHITLRSGSTTGCAVVITIGRTGWGLTSKSFHSSTVPDVAEVAEGERVDLDRPPDVPGHEQPIAPRQRRRVGRVGVAER